MPFSFFTNEIPFHTPYVSIAIPFSMVHPFVQFYPFTFFFLIQTKKKKTQFLIKTIYIYFFS